MNYTSYAPPVIGPVAAGQNTKTTGSVILDLQNKAGKDRMIIHATADQAVDLVIEQGAHTFRHTLTANQSLLLTLPLNPALTNGYVYIDNTTGSSADFTLNVGFSS